MYEVHQREQKGLCVFQWILNIRLLGELFKGKKPIQSRSRKKYQPFSMDSKY